MGTRTDIDPIAVEFGKQVREMLPGSTVIFFGSRARNEHLAESDYDFVVVSDAFSGQPFPERPARLYRCFPWQDQDVEILCYTRSEFERKRKQICIVREAVREGVTV